MAYVAPNWKNGAAPALDAAALQAISDAIVELQNKNTSQDSLIASLQSEISSLKDGNIQVASGSYSGTGRSGSYENSTRINFPFVPGVIFLYCPNDGCCMTITSSSQQNTMYLFGSSGSVVYVFDWTQISVSPKYGTGSIAWYGSSAKRQANESGKKYYYRAFGRVEKSA